MISERTFSVGGAQFRDDASSEITPERLSAAGFKQTDENNWRLDKLSYSIATKVLYSNDMPITKEIYSMHMIRTLVKNILDIEITW